MRKLFIALLLLASLSSAQVYSADGRWADSMNVLHTYKSADGFPRLGVNTYPYLMAEGLVPGHSVLRDIGYNASVGTSEEAVWFQSTGPIWPSAGMTMACSSGSTQDDGTPLGAGTGAQRVIFEYLTASFVEHAETLALNGRTRVLTSHNDIYRINDFWVDTTGTSLSAVGNISLMKTSGDSIYRTIAATRNRSQALIFTVPAGKTFYMTEWWGSSYSSANPPNGTEFRVRATLSPTPKLTTATRLFYHHDAMVLTNQAMTFRFEIPHKYPAGCDIFMGVLSTSSTNTVQAGWSGWVE